MSLMVVNWPLIITLIVISALPFLQRSSASHRQQQPEPNRREAHRKDVETGVELGKPSGAEDAAPRALPYPARWNAATWRLIVPAMAFLLVAGVGAVTFYMEPPSEPSGSVETSAISPLGSDPDGQMLADLSDYSRSIEAEDPVTKESRSELLPDVSTMIERLANRLKTRPEDIEGWQMLGWSYFHTGRFGEAATAYAKALELDPSSAELKLSFEEAKAKATESNDMATVAQLPVEAVGGGSEGESGEQIAISETMPPRARDAAIRSMVDGLAARLERSPRDADGWTRLMRSRVVLGEKSVAATAFRKALAVFKDDPAAVGKIRATAAELGLHVD